MTYERISPTAATIAWLRSEQHIDYARAIAFLTDAEGATRAFYHQTDFDIDLERMRTLGAWAVLRLFALQNMVLATGITNVLELASGLSPTGLLLSEDHSELEYLETDLPDMHVLKSEIVMKILAGRKRENLRLLPVDVLKEEELTSAVHSFSREGPVCVANEGLLQYFTHDEKRQLALNLYRSLPAGSVWITTDIVRKADFAKAFSTSSYTKRMHRVLTEKTGRDMVQCAFESFEEAEALFKECGFRVERHYQLDIVPKLLPLTTIELHPNLRAQQIWKMSR